MATAQTATDQSTSKTAIPDFIKDSPKKLLIGGKWVPAKSGKTFETINPATEAVLCQIAEGDKADVDEAVKAARAAFEAGKWSTMGPHERGRMLLKVADLIDKYADELAMLESLDNGKPVVQAKNIDVRGAAGAFRYFAGWPTKIYGETNPSDPSMFNYTLREPMGVCGLIVPWNFPLLMAVQKIAPALACGNTMVLKPAEQTPLTALRLGEILLEAGIPEGVVNVVTGMGPGAGSSIAEHMDIDKVSFTGSTEVGKLILQASAGNLKRVSLELGGKSPNIILPDADMDAAVRTAVNGVFFNSGQVCVAGTRIFVQGQPGVQAAASLEVLQPGGGDRARDRGRPRSRTAPSADRRGGRSPARRSSPCRRRSAPRRAAPRPPARPPPRRRSPRGKRGRGSSESAFVKASSPSPSE